MGRFDLAELAAFVALRRALSYAQAAVEERRRWDGSSADALAEALDILITAGNMAAAVAAALPVSEAGSALDAEATEPGVARRGAHATLTSGNRPAYSRSRRGKHRRPGPRRAGAAGTWTCACGSRSVRYPGAGSPMYLACTSGGPSGSAAAWYQALTGCTAASEQTTSKRVCG